MASEHPDMFGAPTLDEEVLTERYIAPGGIAPLVRTKEQVARLELLTREELLDLVVLLEAHSDWVESDTRLNDRDWFAVSISERSAVAYPSSTRGWRGALFQAAVFSSFREAQEAINKLVPAAKRKQWAPTSRVVVQAVLNEMYLEAKGISP